MLQSTFEKYFSDLKRHDFLEVDPVEISFVLFPFHELAKMDLKDQFVAINVGKFSCTVFRQENQ